jgi:hypothetical protein
MIKMGESKKYIWILPLIGGILVLIGLLTPVYYFSELGMGEYYWIWGLRYLDAGPYGEHTDWIFELAPKEFTIFLFWQHFVNFLLFLLFSIIILKSAYNAKRDDNLQRFENKWLGMGIAFIILAISFIVEAEIIMNYYFDYYFGMDVSFWDSYDPGFAIIAPFITGALLIVAKIAIKVIGKREEIIMIERDKFQISDSINKGESKRIKYCPQCGQKIMYKQGKFCSSCGYRFGS